MTLLNAEAPGPRLAGPDLTVPGPAGPDVTADGTRAVEVGGSGQSQAGEPPPLPEGSLIAPGYRVLEHISRGEALDVYAVFSDERLCSCIAKVVRPDRRDVERVVNRLRHEGEALLRLGHSHLVRCWEVLSEPQPTVILETIPGLTLEQAVEERLRRFSAEDIAHLGQHLCSAVHYLHGEGVLHLDIRPANVMAEAGIAKLIDLSLAGVPGPARRGRGTRHYMAPEQALGGTLSAATDVWGIGATLYEAATGEPPFAPVDDAEEELYEAHHGYLQLQRPALPLRHWRRRLPRTLATAIERCLERDPADRPGVDELYALLGTVLEEIEARQAAREAEFEAEFEAESEGGIEDVGQPVGGGSNGR